MNPRRGLLPAALALAAALATIPRPGDCAPSAPGPPPSPKAALSFLVVGDWGARSACQQSVARQMGARGAATGIDFVFSTGDNFYPDGVRGVEDPKWRSVFEEVFAAPSLQVPWHVVPGNHDYRGSVEAQVAYSAGQERWTMPGRHHSLEVALGDGTRALFVFLDTSPLVRRYREQPGRYPELAGHAAETEIRWLEDTLSASDASWKLVVGHHTVFSGGVLHGPTRELHDVLPAVFGRHGVQVYFCGHDHNLQHLKPPGATHYVVSGGGTRPRAAGTAPESLFARGACGFVAARLEPGALHLEFVGADGEVLHRATIARAGPDP